MSLLRQHVAKHLAELYIANNEKFKVKKGLAAHRALLQWVKATVKELMQRTDICRSWRKPIQTVTDHSQGHLFRVGEGEQPTEIANPDDDVHVECDTDIAEAEDNLLLEEQSLDAEFAQAESQQIEKRATANLCTVTVSILKSSELDLYKYSVGGPGNGASGKMYPLSWPEAQMSHIRFRISNT
eukprot:4816729-Amphidinium_carterae.2